MFNTKLGFLHVKTMTKILGTRYSQSEYIEEPEASLLIPNNNITQHISASLLISTVFIPFYLLIPPVLIEGDKNFQ